ncbi:MAG: TolC family protein [Bacteroidales bacterium]
MNKLYLLFILFFCISLNYGIAQEKVYRLTLNDVIRIATDQSLDAQIAKNTFNADYWQFRSYKASILPSLNMNATIPNFNRRIADITLPDGSVQFANQTNMTNYLNFNINQNIPLTGGQLYINTNIQRLDVLTDSVVTSYLTNPINIGLRQPIFAYNSMKWEKKIEPLKYEEAKKTYIRSLEDIKLKAVNRFFELAMAQIDVSIEETNYKNNDTLYNISVGRYNMGKIAQNDLLQMELNLLNSKTALNVARFELRDKEFNLKSFLRIIDDAKLELVLPDSIPGLEINSGEAIDLAKKNNPDIVRMSRELIEAESEVSRARAENRFNASIIANFGLTQTAPTAHEAYKEPENLQMISFGIDIPIIDWGQGKGKYKMARSNQEVVKNLIEQQKIDFEQNVLLQVAQFNMQAEQVKTNTKANEVAKNSFDVSKSRFYIGKITVTDLNLALKEKDGAMRNYIASLRLYWNYFYYIRALTLFDFENKMPLNVTFESIIR